MRHAAKVAEGAPFSGVPAGCDALLSSEVDYAVTYNDDGFASIAFADHYLIGSAYSEYEALRCVNVDLSTGESFELDSVLTLTEDMANAWADDFLASDENAEFTLGLWGRDEFVRALRGEGAQDHGDRVSATFYVDPQGRIVLGVTFAVSDGEGSISRGWHDAVGVPARRAGEGEEAVGLLGPCDAARPEPPASSGARAAVRSLLVDARDGHAAQPFALFAGRGFHDRGRGLRNQREPFGVARMRILVVGVHARRERRVRARGNPVGFASSVNVTTAPASAGSPTRKSSTTSRLRASSCARRASARGRGHAPAARTRGARGRCSRETPPRQQPGAVGSR